MTDHRASGSASPPSASPWTRPIAMSLFGGAILASAPSAAVALDHVYIPDVTTLGTTTTIGAMGTYVALGGYTIAGDGGGGILLPQSTTVAACAPDGGLVFGDMATPQNCFVRANPTNSVREWGALCDVSVVVPTASASATWDASAGTLSIPNTLVQTPPQSRPKMGESIAISQIGVPTLWGSSTPAVSMTRFSTLANSGTNYLPGDLISFAGGTFSQQAAIIVDAVGANGAITQWHFLWGGLYNATLTPAGTMTQDDSRSYCGSIAGTIVGCGTLSHQAGGATMMPAWSGWSVLNSQSFSNMGTGYAVGDIVTLGIGDTFVNQGHYATLVVEGTTTSGGVTAYDWLDYGSFQLTGASNVVTLTAISSTRHGTTGTATGLAFAPIAWTQAPFATTITNVMTGGGTGTISVTLQDRPPFPAMTGTFAIKYLYYGDDDAPEITKAIKEAPKGGLIIPAGCGTSQTLNLSPSVPNVGSAQNFSASLNGANLQSSGVYAFAASPSQRGTHPVLAHVIYSGLLNTANNGFVSAPGGGFSNMVVEALGIPEGYGYYGLLQSAGTPTGYVGPTFGTITNNIPTAGNVVEIDASSQMRIDKVLISNGGIGSGNSVLQCGMDAADPAHLVQTLSIANITLTDSRLDDNFAFSGPTDPDYVLRLDASCQGSAYDAVTAYDGTKADILVYGGNLFSRVHLDSDAANSNVHTDGIQYIAWPSPATFGLAGMADYGFYIVGNTSLNETQCDIVNRSCVFTIPNGVNGSLNPGQITDTQMKCGAFTNNPPGYTGVELSDGTANTTVTGTASSDRCAIYPFQLVRLDGGLDPSTSLCNNSNSPVAGCTGYQGGFTPGQLYTQPAVSYAPGTVTVSGLYAMPFFSPAGGGVITQLELNVTSTISSHCLVGIYNAAVQAPTSLIAIGTVTAMGTVTVSGTGTAAATLASPGAALAPGTLYFFAVGCDGPVVLTGVKGSGGGATGAGGLSVPLVGASARTDTTSGIVANSWTYASGLPTSFGSVTRNSGAWVPNVYAKP